MDTKVSHERPDSEAVMESTIPGLQGEHRRASLLVTYGGPPVPIESSYGCFSLF